MFSEEDKGHVENIVHNKLLTMANSIVNMRKKLDRVNTRFSDIRLELSDQHEYVKKLAQLKEVLEDQGTILKREIVEIVQRVLSRRLSSFLRNNIPQNGPYENVDVNNFNLEKAQKEAFNRMVKIRNEIKDMKDIKKFQTMRLSELERLKEIIFRLMIVEDQE